MFQKLLKFAAWAGLCVIAYSTLSPLRDRPTLLTSLKLEHLAAFAILGTLFCLAYPRRTLAVLLIVLCSAALLELLQLLTPDRHARTFDVLQKMVGGAAGVFAGRVVLRFDRARFWLLRASDNHPGLEIRCEASPRRASRTVRKAANIRRHTNLLRRRVARRVSADRP
jgi:VanZ family protein